MLRHMISVVLGLVLTLPNQATPTISIHSLLAEMADKSTPARLPEISYRQLQASSYDRAQTDPKDPNTWFANADYGQFIRTEQQAGKTEWVVMEHNGPGAITRIWTPLLADKDKMLVRFYFDGEAHPSIEEPFNDLMRGKNTFKPPYAYISWPNSGVESGVGSDLYYPIPFAKSCKVTMSELPFYYSISYRAFRAGTHVETFTMSGLQKNTELARKVAQSLSLAAPEGRDSKQPNSIVLRAGDDYLIPLPKGASSVSGMRLDFDHAPELQELRSIVVEMKFDGERTVWCPIGDFFGCGIHSRPVWDRYRSVEGNASMSCSWRMPYQHSAELRFHNYGVAPLAFHVQVRNERWKWDARSLHFHTTWRSQYPLATRPMSDWNYLTANGTGIYVGDTLTVFSPVAAWYGEGDERVYVDGEPFPSHLGTGTEDYYGYAWGMAEHFSSAFISMPEKDIKGRDNWSGFTTTSRVRGLDAIPFDTSLRFDMEIWNWADSKVGYSAASFWYARPGATSNREPDPTGATAILPEWSAGIKGAIECETMQVLSKSDGIQVETQTGGLTDGSWSNNTQLFIRCSRVGDQLKLRLPVKKRGRYRVLLYATKSYDYGIIRFSLDRQASKGVDLWSEKPVASGPIEIGVFDLKQGEATFSAEVTGTNPKSTGSRYYFGLDCLLLKEI